MAKQSICRSALRRGLEAERAERLSEWRKTSRIAYINIYTSLSDFLEHLIKLFLIQSNKDKYKMTQRIL